MPDTTKIRELNDQLRQTFKGGKIAVTPGVLALGDLPTILQQLRDFSDFDHDSCEHDFGAFKYNGRSEISGAGPLIFFKLDYYDTALQFGSPDPSIPELTSRVLTIMLAQEY
jgi:hypothetical protein